MIMTTTITAAATTTTTTIFIVSLTAMAGLFGCVSSTNKIEVCNRETKDLKCGGNDVIYIDSALGGRMSKGRCIANLIVNCSADVTLYLEHKCAGRRQCSVSIDHTLDNSPHRCHPDLKIYLEIVYSCIPVESPRTKCNDSPYVIHPKEPSGYLARVVTTETSIGSSSCPWVIEVKSGLTIALTLLDFGIWRLANQSSDGRTMCQIYMNVKAGSGSPMRVCGGTKKEEKSFFTSNTNSVQIAVIPGDDQFLVKYEVLGCPDLSPIPPHSSVDRHGDRLTIGCEAGRGGGGGLEPVVLTCVDGNWTGPALVNCSTLLPPLKGPSPEGQSSSFGGVLMVVVVAAAVVVVILVATVAIVVLWRQRILKRRSEEMTGATGAPLTENYPFIATPGCFDPAAFPGSHYALTPATAPTLPGGGGPIRLLHDGSRRPSAELLQRLDYSSTLQSRRAHPGALPKNLGHSVSFSSFRQLPGTAALAAAGDGAYNGVNAMMVYCPYHGTITRVHGGHPHHPHHDPRGVGPGDCAAHHPLSHSHEDVMGRGGGGYDDDHDHDHDGNQFMQQGIYQELDPQMISPDPRC